MRDRLLASDLVPYDQFAIEALAMLGPDLDERAETFLRKLAEDGGAHLAPVVESIGPVLAMSEYQPQLLITLSEAFYIERYDDEFGWQHGGLDDGIRGHQKTGAINPMAAWYYGPFYQLLNTCPVQALALINRMLDHAAFVRVSRRQPWETRLQSNEPPLGIDLELPGVGVRRCVGDVHVWAWYRGSSVGPYPCMSALLAVERFADHLADSLHLSLARVVALLLRDCHNLAMPGLVVGFLVRHLDRVGNLLDTWLARPELWHLEFARTVGEGHLHVQGADPPELVGRDRRRQNLRDVGIEMTIGAALADDQHRLAALAAVADQLIRHAHDLMEDGDESDDMLTIEGWASALRPENYRAHQVADGRLIIQHEPPEKIASGLAPSLATLARGNEAIRLQMTYARLEDRVAPVNALIEDLAIARGLADDPPVHGVLHLEDSIAAVAAAAVVAHAQGRACIPDEDLHWAAEVLVEAATHPRDDEMSYEEATMYPWAADRSAAASLPALLLPLFDHLDIDRLWIAEALRSCATSVFDEVRLALAHGVKPIWETPCETRTDIGSCRHKMAWEAMLAGLRDCRLGDRDGTAQRRLPDYLEGPYDETLPMVETERLLVNRLTAPLVATVPVASSGNCVSDAARRLLPILFDAHRRGLGHWARKGYDRHRRHHQCVAELLIRLAAVGDSELTEYIRIFSSNASALSELLRDLALRFTYDDDLRSTLHVVWRQVMTSALDALEAGADLHANHFRSDTAVARLLPTPQLDTGDTDPDATFERARQNWVAPDAIADLFTRWLPFARRKPDAVDAVVQLAHCASLQWQATIGLVWVEDIIDRDYAAVARRCWFLTRWLQTVRTSGELNEDGTARWRRIVDGLAAEGDSRAVPLQQAEE